VLPASSFQPNATRGRITQRPPRSHCSGGGRYPWDVAAYFAVKPLESRSTRDTPEVVECHRITGEDCFFLELHLRSIDDLEPLLDRFTPFGRTTTSLIHSSPVANRPLPLPEGPETG
jgi:Lrp/AsnC ligand binding domain